MADVKVQKPVSWNLSTINKIATHMKDTHSDNFSETVETLVLDALNNKGVKK